MRHSRSGVVSGPDAGSAFRNRKKMQSAGGTPVQTWRGYVRDMKISLITGDEPHYQAGLVSGLAEQDLVIDVIGGDSMARVPIMSHPRVNFRNLSGNMRRKRTPNCSIFNGRTSSCSWIGPV